MTKPASRHLPANIHRTTIHGCDVRYLRAGSGTVVVFVHTLRTQLDMFLQVIGQLDTTQAEVIAAPPAGKVDLWSVISWHGGLRRGP